MILLIGSEKGGVGKSMIATNLVEMGAMNGRIELKHKMLTIGLFPKRRLRKQI